MSPLPASLWREVSVDFKQLSSCDYLLVITDDYSRYPVVELVGSTSAAAVIPQLDKTFSTFGIPKIVRSDNGPPFNGRKVTPLWPRANGQVERFMRTIKKSVAAAKAEGKPWKTELFQLLRNYWSTPHSLTGIALCGTSF